MTNPLVKHAATETPLRCLTHAAIETPQRSEAMVVVAEGQSLISVKTSDKQNCLSHLFTTLCSFVIALAGALGHALGQCLGASHRGHALEGGGRCRELLGEAHHGLGAVDREDLIGKCVCVCVYTRIRLYVCVYR